MDIEKLIGVMKDNIQGNLKNREAAERLDLKERTFSRRKKAFIETGKTKFQKGCIIPFTEEEAVVLFKELVFMSQSEKMTNVLQRFCDKTTKKLNTVRKKTKILSYPSLFYYKPLPNQIIVPIKSKEEYKGGIMFGIDEEKDNIIVDYISEVINDDKNMIFGEYDENYINLIDFIISIMSKTYFQNVKNITKPKIEPAKKFESYYKEFKTHIEDNGEEGKLKDILNILIKKYNNNVDSLTFPPNLTFPHDVSSFTPLPEDNDYELKDNDNNSLLSSLPQTPTSNKDEVDYSITDIASGDNILPTQLILLSPPPSPRFRSRSSSRERSPRQRDSFSKF